ncbi:BTB/POZ domain and ankyrin repeat-containing protein NPR1-like [Syzygium oleosum]|uniref:BTB/POZ domain and ankyrin repeat-containing protein NPR1-like n=1 Tax=Syzygium oleosum TaxID=219896 RepID=UPI0011D2175D|nr:BTB/POZ domain and ankyrin repeat-containing protein NPR1-like [Syzygium oleosum]
MAFSIEPSSSLSFTSSSHLSNNSVSNNHLSGPCSSETGHSLEVISLGKLSSSLERLLSDSTPDYSDADIVVENISVGVHRCILAARSDFFTDLFKREKGSCEKEGKPKYYMDSLLPFGKVGHEAFLIFLSYVYTGKLKRSPVEVSTCVDNTCNHDACSPAINFAVELMYASYVFQIRELVSLLQRHLVNFVGKARSEDIIPILTVAFHCELNQLVMQCVDRVARSDLDDISLEKELPHRVAEEIKLLRLKSEPKDEANLEITDPLHEKRIRRIHKALDSDDIELVTLLLSESNITLDQAYGLHYAAAYCDAKVVSELLGLGVANVNLRNRRGYTVLHVAAMRKEPKIIVPLLSKGARASELTSDGQNAVSICRRLTRPKDYHAKIEQCQEANKDRLCIDVLEREILRNPLAGDASVSSPIVSDDLHMKLLYLENRVAFARLFFPTEAKLAMDIAHAEMTAEFAGLSARKGSSGNLREVDLNETPIVQNKRLRSRMEALQRTVEMGRRYFPNCSEVLDKFMEDDLPDLCYLEKGTPDEQRLKTRRFMELKDDVQKAFSKDKAEMSLSGLSSSSSSSSLKYNNKIRRS